ncbi:MAG TPA: riboflavin synthase [Puia sp.]|nr:riboflavin synthase [Puia sp.]
MFTGIIEDIGKIVSVLSVGTNRTFWVLSKISGELKADQSVAHDGVCLTVESTEGKTHSVTAIAETLSKSNIGEWKTGGLVNLERSLKFDDRIDGHLVQGHSDTIGFCISKTERKGSWEYTFEFSKKFSHLVVEKGSICLNGISLTAFNVGKKTFSVAIIPYTYEHTNIKEISIGSSVNLEFDIIGKYASRVLDLKYNR